MDTVLKLLGGIVVIALAIGGLFLLIPLGAGLGAIAGWVVGKYFFVATFAKLTALTGFQAYQLGAMAGVFAACLPRNSNQ